MFNFNYDANVDDGSCVPYVFGCMDTEALNFNSTANTDFGGILCEYPVYGCTDPTMYNYNSTANTDDGSCVPYIFGCLDESALNFNPEANTDFGGLLCVFPSYGCTDSTA